MAQLHARVCVCVCTRTALARVTASLRCACRDTRRLVPLCAAMHHHPREYGAHRLGNASIPSNIGLATRPCAHMHTHVCGPQWNGTPTTGALHLPVPPPRRPLVSWVHSPGARGSAPANQALAAVRIRPIVSWLRSAGARAIDLTDRQVSRHVPRGFKLVARALTRIGTVTDFSARDITLALLVLWRLQTGQRSGKAGGARPPKELEAAEAATGQKPGALEWDSERRAVKLPVLDAYDVRPVVEIEDVQRVHRFLKFANAAYAGSDDAACADLGLRKADLVMSRWEADADKILPAFFVVIDRQLQSVVVSIRGTWSLGDALINFAADPESFFGGTVHGGMFRAAQQIDRYLRRHVDLAGMFRSRPDYTLTFVGHSMAGGVASMLATMHKVRFPHTRAHAFSPPSCMSRSVAESCCPYVNSYVNGDDIVARFHLDSAIRLRQQLVEVSLQDEVMRAFQLDGVLTSPAVASVARALSDARTSISTGASTVSTTVSSWLEPLTSLVARSPKDTQRAESEQSGAAMLQQEPRDTKPTQIELKGGVQPAASAIHAVSSLVPRLASVAQASLGAGAKGLGLDAAVLSRLVDSAATTAASAASNVAHPVVALRRLRGRRGRRRAAAQEAGSDAVSVTGAGNPSSQVEARALAGEEDDAEPGGAPSAEQMAPFMQSMNEAYVASAHEAAAPYEPRPYVLYDDTDDEVPRKRAVDTSGDAIATAPLTQSAATASYILTSEEPEFVVDPADPYGAEEGHEDVVQRDFTLDEAGPTLVSAAATATITPSPLGTYILSEEPDAGADESVRAWSGPSKATPTAPVAPIDVSGLQYYPPGSIYYLAYPRGYTRLAKREPEIAATDEDDDDPSLAATSAMPYRDGREGHAERRPAGVSASAIIEEHEEDGGYDAQDIAADEAAMHARDRSHIDHDDGGAGGDDDEDGDERDAHAFRRRLIRSGGSRSSWWNTPRMGLGSHRGPRRPQRPAERSDWTALSPEEQLFRGYFGPVLLKILPKCQPKLARNEAASRDSGLVEAANDAESSFATQPAVPCTAAGSPGTTSTVTLDDKRLFSHVVLSEYMLTDHLCAAFDRELTVWERHIAARAHSRTAARAQADAAARTDGLATSTERAQRPREPATQAVLGDDRWSEREHDLDSLEDGDEEVVVDEKDVWQRPFARQ